MMMLVVQRQVMVVGSDGDGVNSATIGGDDVGAGNGDDGMMV